MRASLEVTALHRTYDLFEILPDGSPLWRDSITGLKEALAKLKELGDASPNELFAMHLPSKEVVGRVNARPAGQ